MKALRKHEARGKVSPAELHKLAEAKKGYVIEIEEGVQPPKFDAAGHITESWGTAMEGDQVLMVFESITGKKQFHRENVMWNRDVHLPDTLHNAIASGRRPLKVRLRTTKERAEERVRARKVMEELLTLKALAKDSQNCPRCNVLISRSQGCNHMTCTNCGTHFCYRCGAKLDAADPYSHFKTGGCQTFDAAEVNRINQEEQRNRGMMDNELERLREEFGDQRDLFAMFARTQGYGARAEQQRRQAGDSRCPTCRQFNVRLGNLNHISCGSCRTSYCHHCGKRIHGGVRAHFCGEGACPMHGA